ncbi:MAG: hypothetical protein IBX47_13280 [Desulfuromonadales bacterium]|nr:hypothetical protein [Desulfuromonadales bacterium]
MTDHSTTPYIDWQLSEFSAKAELKKLRRTFHEEEKEQNKNRLLYPPDEIMPAVQFHYGRERRN